MELTKTEKDILAYLVKREHDQIHKEEETIIDQTPDWLAAEVKYEEALEKLLRKLKS